MNKLFEFISSTPIANLFIVAGLIFLGIAVVGNISGKIKPDKAGGQCIKKPLRMRTHV